MATLESLSADIASLRSDVKNLAKLVRKVRNHQEDPTGEKSKERTKNNGFNRKMEVSDTLKEFLGLGKEELISRTQVTKKFTEYCKAHDLQNGPDKRGIHPDKTVMKLLRLNKDSEPLTFFNLQKYMKVHYPNKEGVFSN